MRQENCLMKRFEFGIVHRVLLGRTHQDKVGMARHAGYVATSKMLG